MRSPRVIPWFLCALFFATAELHAHPLDNWYARFTNSSPNTLFQDIAYGNGMFVAVQNSGGVAISADGRNWSTNRPVTKSLRSITYGAGQFVAVGDDGTIITSTNGSNWVLRNSTIGIPFQSVEYGNARFVGVGSASTPTRRVVFVSEDGIAWSIQFSNYLFTGPLCFGNGLFVQAESPRTNLLTADGTNWWRQFSGTSEGLYTVRFAGAMFVAIDTTSRVLASTDGTNWSLRGSTTIIRPQDIAYGNGHWVAVGISGKPVYSADLKNWKTSATGEGMDCTTFGNGFFAGAYNKLLQSDPVILLQTGAENIFYLSGPTNVAYEIQAADTFGPSSSWSTIISNLTITASPTLWSDPDFLNHSQRFYRTLLP